MKITAVGSGYWVVTVDGVAQAPRHTQQFEAAEHAINLELADPTRNVRILHNAEYTVEEPIIVGTSPQPVPIPVPVPVPVPQPAPSNTRRVSYVDPIDNLIRFYDIAYTKALNVSPDGAGDGVTAPMHPSKIFDNLAPGTMFVHKPGQYAQNYGGNWGNRNYAFGPSANGIILLGEPGAELVSPNSNEHGNIVLFNGTGTADNVTIAGFSMQGGGECLFGGGYTVNESGAKHTVVVGNIFRARYTGNSMTGLVSMQGDGCKIIGNIFEETGWAAFYNNNHALYIQSGADGVLVEGNLFRKLQVGHVIQVHQDGVAQQYDNIVIRRNKITAIDPMNCRGITVSNVQDTSTILIEDNLLDNVGQQFAGLSIYGGIVTAKNNVFRSILGGTVGKIWLSGQFGHQPILYRKDNIIEGGTGPDYGVSGVPTSNIKDL